MIVIRLKKIVTIGWLIGLIGAIGAIFWYNELQYQLPTPLPECYQPVQRGSNVVLPAGFSATNGKPVFLHFFNPDCPCSKFNIPHFKELVNEYGHEVDFKIVVLTDKDYEQENIRKKFQLDIPISFNKAIADSCGVYSTPQAVLLDAQSRLYYRGNYNRTRYCTDKKSDYASIAIDGLVRKKVWLKFNQLALVSYGCSLPVCEY